MNTFPRFWHRLTPIQSIVLGFALLVLFFAILFCLPISSAKGGRQSLIDAIFVATSGISTTGLAPVDIGSYYSLFGQIALLVLIQIGGLGYMVFILLIALILGHKPTLYTRTAFRESLAGISLSDIKKMSLVVIIFAFFFEFLCAFILTVYWAHKYPLSRAVYLGIFHSISGFCTAGFGLFSDNMVSVGDSLLANIVIDITCFAGAIGFFVLYDLYSATQQKIKEKKSLKLSLHSKIALTTSLSLMGLGALAIFITEKWQPGLSIAQRLLNSFFQTISASTTTGYNTIDIGAMSTTGLLVLIILMFIGASPGSTGGGIKTTTFAVLLLAIRSNFLGKRDINAFKKRIPEDTFRKSLTIGLIASFLIIIDMLILTLTEKVSFVQILFEIISAFGNVGLSTGITPMLSVIGKLVLCVTMFTGRVGPLAIGFSLIGRTKTASYRYWEESVFVG